jgi:F-type H+-transporting ATPase subunit gamma
MSQRDVKNRISSVKNIQKITRAMEMVAAARLRRAEQRITALRPYAGAIRRMTRQAAEAAGGEISGPAAARARASARRPWRSCSSPATAGSPARSTGRSSAAACARRSTRARGQGGRLLRFRPPRRRLADFRKRTPVGAYVGFTDRPPTPTRARSHPT